MHLEPEKIDVLILCGGKGERLKTVSGDLPKILIDVAGEPFINILIDDLLQYGFNRFILSIGYLKELVKNHFNNASFDVEFSEEDTPLGTGGAVKRAVKLIRSPSFLVMNGDSICKTDFSRFCDFHVRKGGIQSVVLSKPRLGNDYGVIEIDDFQRIKSFMEKTECKYNNMFINAGIYLMRRDIFLHMPEENRFSLEYDLFPKILDLGCYGFLSDGELIDIGTPERYERANQLLSK